MHRTAQLTNGIYVELHHQGTLVVAMPACFIDTEMALWSRLPKTAGSVDQQAFGTVEAGEIEVLADERSRFVRASLLRDHELIYPQVQAFWALHSRGTQ